jgi:predicted neutral ceramidase superfamily lipid hydrolase
MPSNGGPYSHEYEARSPSQIVEAMEKKIEALERENEVLKDEYEKILIERDSLLKVVQIKGKVDKKSGGV